MLARKQVEVDGNTALDHKQIVTQFSRISVNGQLLQDNSPVYLMLHKPKGVVCATQDKRHTTVIDLIDHPMKDHLHIAGRLDFNSTGIVLLTNDGHWSRNLFSPTAHIQKYYRVTLAETITEETVRAFAEGIYFKYENITTRPATLTPEGARCATVALTEGRYHQIKRMFGVFQNEVLSLHRYQVGALTLDDLPEGKCRLLKQQSAGSNSE